MITCPVCEHPQAQGTECDICGRPFPPDVVHTAGHADPPPEPVPGLELTAVVAPALPTPALAPNAPCVWCGHVQGEGRICDRCGMQRHRGERLGTPAAATDDDTPGCPECGHPSAGSRCRNCGARLPEAS